MDSLIKFKPYRQRMKLTALQARILHAIEHGGKRAHPRYLPELLALVGKGKITMNGRDEQGFLLVERPEAETQRLLVALIDTGQKKIKPSDFEREAQRLIAEGKMPSLEHLLDVTAETRLEYGDKIRAAKTKVNK